MNKKGTNNVPGKAPKPRAGRQTPKKRRKPGVSSAKGQALLAGLLGGGGPMAGPGGPMGGPMGGLM